MYAATERHLQSNSQGNRELKVLSAPRELMDAFIVEQFDPPRHPPAASVYRAYELAPLSQLCYTLAMRTKEKPSGQHRPTFTETARRTQIIKCAIEVIAGYVLAFASAILIVVSVSIYANIVAVGVAEEKSSRIMEILVNAATPFQLLAGKIVGIGAACLTQMSCLVIVGIGALLLQNPLQTALFGTNAGGFIQYLTSVSIPFYFLLLVYILLAFFLYATLYAGLGSLVTRQDEVQNATMLPSLLVMSGWFLVYLAVFSPDAGWTKVLSYIPFWTPMLMLVRLARGTVVWWEIVLTIALMLVAILACTWFAARLYRLGVLMYGQRPSLRQLVKLVWMGKNDHPDLGTL
ncbi:hypothetical protein KSC_008710 [Ktedonobacter sp. SOSP1-52]|uniref:ABC transporter permease n=1 Tax=Ktedonobacter sp. SOSP1-52 TaxID=2778366 RepID=UPI001915ECE7|nr:ABC transporter permease [Ktedonobacter sp. SOSP1-52]GHO61979.1 hypothetical protein KSC_008710 [Ktedonobacter sp. SOSP1-52]